MAGMQACTYVRARITGKIPATEKRMKSGIFGVVT